MDHKAKRTRYKNQRTTRHHYRSGSRRILHKTKRGYQEKTFDDDGEALWDGKVEPTNPGDEDLQVFIEQRFDNKYGRREDLDDLESQDGGDSEGDEEPPEQPLFFNDEPVFDDPSGLEKRDRYLKQKAWNHRAAEVRIARKTKKQVQDVEHMKKQEIVVSKGKVTYTPQRGTLKKSMNIPVINHEQKAPKAKGARPVFKKTYIEERRSTATSTTIKVDRGEFIELGAGGGYCNLPRWSSTVVSSCTEYVFISWVGEQHSRVRQALKFI
jgi:hypothetical protein